MTAPSEGNQVTLEEMEQHTKDEAGKESSDLTKIKFDGDKIPETLRGKSAAEVMDYVSRVETALKTSEEARKQAQQLADVASRPAPAPVETEPAPKELTDEEIQEIYEKDQLQGIQLMQDRAIRKATREVEARLAPLFQGTSSSAEQQARERYAVEFELFGTEIEKMVAGLPNRSVMANPAAWDDLISFVRGKPGNLDKVIDKKMEQKRQDAQQQQQQTAGFHTRGTERPASTKPTSVDQLDATQKEIAAQLGMSPEDYIKWSM